MGNWVHFEIILNRRKDDKKVIERFSIECRKTKTKSNYLPVRLLSQSQTKTKTKVILKLITFDTQLKSALIVEYRVKRFTYRMT